MSDELDWYSITIGDVRIEVFPSSSDDSSIEITFTPPPPADAPVDEKTMKAFLDATLERLDRHGVNAEGSIYYDGEGCSIEYDPKPGEPACSARELVGHAAAVLETAKGELEKLHGISLLTAFQIAYRVEEYAPRVAPGHNAEDEAPSAEVDDVEEAETGQRLTVEELQKAIAEKLRNYVKIDMLGTVAEKIATDLLEMFPDSRPEVAGDYEGNRGKEGDPLYEWIERHLTKELTSYKFQSGEYKYLCGEVFEAVERLYEQHDPPRRGSGPAHGL